MSEHPHLFAGAPTSGSGSAEPPMDPASGVRMLRLAPHEMVERSTRTSDLLVLAHLGIPRIAPDLWSLAIDGMVANPRSLTLDDIKARPKRIIEAVHQCCGSPLEPRQPTRRVANVQWGGVDLASLLAEVGVDGKARFLWSYGADRGDFGGQYCSAYLKDLPLARLASGDVLLAYELNGEPLPAEHGFPLRLVVPGYYGTNSVKWLKQLHLSDRRAESIFASKLYNDALTADDIAAGLPASRPVWAIAPEAIIVSPAPGREFFAGETITIWGWAWSFRGIERVEISWDGGATFVTGELEARRGWTWQRFSLALQPTTSGEIEICARAFDADGVAQPFDDARNAIHRVPIRIKPRHA